jgi:hypothetical protein
MDFCGRDLRVGHAEGFYLQTVGAVGPEDLSG